MKPVKDAKVTVKGLGAQCEAELEGEGEAVVPAAPVSRAIKAVAPRTADADRAAGRYAHVPPRRVTRSMAKVDATAKEGGDTLRPPSVEPDRET